MARSSSANRIRVLGDGSGLIDELGHRWDRVRGTGYFLTPAEVTALGEPRRFLITGSYGTPVTEVAPNEYRKRASAAREPREQAFRLAGDIAVLLDESDC